MNRIRPKRKNSKNLNIMLDSINESDSLNFLLGSGESMLLNKDAKFHNSNNKSQISSNDDDDDDDDDDEEEKESNSEVDVLKSNREPKLNSFSFNNKIKSESQNEEIIEQLSNQI